MYDLVFAANNVLCYRPEPCLEIRNCILVRVVIVHSKSTSEVYVVYLQSLALKICHDVVYSLTLKAEDFFNSGDLRSDMEMQADEVDVFAFLDDLDELVELVL